MRLYYSNETGKPFQSIPIFQKRHPFCSCSANYPWKVATGSVFRADAPLAEKPEASNEGSSDGEVEIRINSGL
jgi:hypothetical protein